MDKKIKEWRGISKSMEQITEEGFDLEHKDKRSYYQLVEEFNKILANGSITSLFQPIIDLKTGEVFGYESLSRGPEHTYFFSPLTLLKFAEDQNKLWELEQLFRIKALQKAQKMPPNVLLFLNVDPNVIKSANFRKGFTKDFSMENGIVPDSIVFEITERTAIQDYKGFKQVLEYYTEQGYMIAIDDVGAGYSGLKTILETHPHFLKIDMDLIRNIHQDSFKQEMIKALVDISKTTHIKLIAEGIESKEELRTLVALGVHGGQGYYLHRPAKEFAEPPDEVREIIINSNHISNNYNNYSADYHYVHNILKEVQSFYPETPCLQIQEFFNNHQAFGVCICENGYPIGTIMKSTLNSAMAKQYGYAIYANRPVSLLMNRNPLIVDYYTSIQHVAKQAMERSDKEVYDDIIVTRGNKYIGMVSMKNLLEYAINYERNYARELNPLTSLPGNMIINRVLQDTITYGNNACICYVDLDNFKAYNDIYGFENGDKIIQFTAETVKGIVKKALPINSFIGHIGGDDFIFVIEGAIDQYNMICSKIIHTFNDEILKYFDDCDRVNEYMETEDRTGNIYQVPLTSLSIAGIYGEFRKMINPERLSQHMAVIKKRVKKLKGSNYMLLDCSQLQYKHPEIKHNEVKYIS